MFAKVTISAPGSYYVYVGGGSQPNAALGLTVQRNGVDRFGVHRSATNANGVDTAGHGAVVHLDRGDRLRVIAEPHTAGYSGLSLRQTSFFGFLVV